MRPLFDPVRGIGVSFLRQPIGSSDFTAAAEHYTYDDVPAGQTDFALRHFSIAHDEAQILPLLRRAKQLNPRLTVMATPWSPPAWMKTSDSLVGGRLKDDPARLRRVRALPGQVRAGVRARPASRSTTCRCRTSRRTGSPSGYPGTDMPVRQQVAVIEALGPAAAGGEPADEDPRLRPQLGHPPRRHRHHAARRGPGDRLPVPGARQPGRAVDRRHRVPLLLRRPERADRAARRVPATRASGSPSAPARTAPTDPPAQFFRDTLTWHARNIIIGTTRNWAKSVVNWNIALDSTGGPHLGGCDTCTGLVTVQPDGTVTTQRRVLHDRPPGEVRAAGRGPDRQHVVRHHRLERADHGRRVPQPGRLDRARRAQRERRPALLRGRGRRPAVRVHAARRRAGDLHLAAQPLAARPATTRCRCAARPRPPSPAGETPPAAVDGDASTRWSSGTGAGARASTCRSTWAGRRPSAGSRSTAAATSATTPAAGSCRPATTAPRWRTARRRDRHRPAHHRRRAAGPAPATCGSTSTGGAGNWWSIADVRLYD